MDTKNNNLETRALNAQLCDALDGAIDTLEALDCFGMVHTAFKAEGRLARIEVLGVRDGVIVCGDVFH